VIIALIVGLLLGGLIVGALGRLVHPGPDPMSVGLTLAIRVVAALVTGAFLPGLLGFVGAVALAAVFVAAYGARGRVRSGGR
jgi:hypothetical protein